MPAKRKHNHPCNTSTTLGGGNVSKESPLTSINEFLTIIGLQGYAPNITLEHQFCSLEQFHKLVTCDDDILKLGIRPLAHRISILQGLRKLKKTRNGSFSLPQQDVYQHLAVLPTKHRDPSPFGTSDWNYDDLPFLTPFSDGVVDSQPQASLQPSGLRSNDLAANMSIGNDVDVVCLDQSCRPTLSRGMSSNKLNDVFLSQLRKLCQWYDTSIRDIYNRIPLDSVTDDLKTNERTSIQEAITAAEEDNICNALSKADVAAPVNIFYRVKVIPDFLKEDARSLVICEEEIPMNFNQKKAKNSCSVEHDITKQSTVNIYSDNEQSTEDNLERSNIEVDILVLPGQGEDVAPEDLGDINVEFPSSAIVQDVIPNERSLSPSNMESVSSPQSITGVNATRSSFSSYDTCAPSAPSRATLRPGEGISCLPGEEQINVDECQDEGIYSTHTPRSVVPHHGGEFCVHQSDAKNLPDGNMTTPGIIEFVFCKDKEAPSGKWSPFPYSVEEISNSTPQSILKYYSEAGLAKIHAIQPLSPNIFQTVNGECLIQSDDGKGRDIYDRSSFCPPSSSRVLSSPSLTCGVLHDNTACNSESKAQALQVNSKDKGRTELEQLAYAATELRQISLQTLFIHKIAPYTLQRAPRWKDMNKELATTDRKKERSQSLQRNLELLTQSDRELVRKRIRAEEKKEEIKNAIAGLAADAMQFHEVCPAGVKLLEPQEVKAMGVYQTANPPLFETALLRDAVCSSDALDTIRHQFCVGGGLANAHTSNTAVKEANGTYPGIQHLTSSRLEALFKYGGTPIVPEGKGTMKRTAFLSNKWALRRFGAGRRNRN